MKAKAAANPMLAFGHGPEGRTCDECFSYVHGYSVCIKRNLQNRRTGGQSRKARPHNGNWPACKYFNPAMRLAPVR